ncbi:hypothetical protein MEO93_20890 [Dolichospermum sp. ST_sed3]|nr:hypothetical protein [Dolichospermum sp. ST_sed3]
MKLESYIKDIVIDELNQCENENYNSMPTFKQLYLLCEYSIKELLQHSIKQNVKFDPKRILYIGLNSKTKTAYFKVGKYNQQLRFEDIKYISRLKGSYSEKIKMALDENVKIDCNCKDFGFSGKRYFLHQVGASIYPENRYPHIKDPDLQQGSCCKHLNFLLENIDKYIPLIEKDFIKSQKSRTIIKRKKGIQPK